MKTKNIITSLIMVMVLGTGTMYGTTNSDKHHEIGKDKGKTEMHMDGKKNDMKHDKHMDGKKNDMKHDKHCMDEMHKKHHDMNCHCKCHHNMNKGMHKGHK